MGSDSWVNPSIAAKWWLHVTRWLHSSSDQVPALMARSSRDTIGITACKELGGLVVCVLTSSCDLNDNMCNALNTVGTNERCTPCHRVPDSSFFWKSSAANAWGYKLQKVNSARKNIAFAGVSASNEGSVVMSYRALRLFLRVCPLCVVLNT